MFQLYSRYYCNVHRDTFYRDMNEKDWVIVLKDLEEIVGFSTLQVIELHENDTRRIFLFSGDTIVDPTHWRDSKLAGCFGHFMLRLIAEHPDTPLHWFLISKGYRTYRFLPVYFNVFYPACDCDTPPHYARLLDAVAASKFNGTYDARAGLVRCSEKKDRLRPDMCLIPEGRRNDLHVRFFLEKNPAYFNGDELACIADISKENLNRYAWRVIENTAVIWDE